MIAAAELVLECVVCRHPEDRCVCSSEEWRTAVAEMLDRAARRPRGEREDRR